MAARLWDHLCRPMRERIATALGLDAETAGRWAAFWIAAHDIGKVTPCFQLRGNSAKLKASLEASQFDSPAGNEHHTKTGTKVLYDALKSDGEGWPAIPAVIAHKVAVAVGGHHGAFPTSWDELHSVLGNDRWAASRRDLLKRLAVTFGVTRQTRVPTTAGTDQSVWMLLAGLTAVADWIGSNEEFFPWAGSPDEHDIEKYTTESKRLAGEALRRVGWARPDPDSTPRTFADVTGLKDIPRQLQQQVIDLLGDSPMTTPRLFLIEAPMGEGKTEAAWYVAHHWDHRGGAGTYVALPTMATSNQMFDRVKQFLELAGGGNLMLLHGKAGLNENFAELKMNAKHPHRQEELYDDDRRPSGVVAEGWFANDKKQAMLAPFGVGTIDQALLSVLQTKHGFVRLFGLAGKCVILDEVHAYDAYMTTLLERLLRWLAALGCPVVLLSATLPADKRERMLEAYSGKSVTPMRFDTKEDGWGDYPRLVTVGISGEVAEVRNFAADPTREKKIRLNWVEDGDLARNIQERLANGGCAAVIRNTVGLAQDTYLRLKAKFADTDVAVELFHARFPFGRRQEIETTVLDRFGKGPDGKPENAKRPAKAVLVATQVIEQSLDLDFDVMYTDVAPVDLVLQRAGRLHRHERGKRGDPYLWLIRPVAKDGKPDFGPSEWVYPRFVLLRSLFALEACDGTICLPGHLEGLVEQVYGKRPLNLPPGSADDLTASEKVMREEHRVMGRNAKAVMIWTPTTSDLLEQPNLQLMEDNPEAHRKVQAATRDTEPTVQLIVVYRRDGKDHLDPDGRTPLVEGEVPDVPRIKRLLMNEVTLTHKGCVFHYAALAVPSGWARCGMLRCHRLLRVSPSGQSSSDPFIRLDHHLGVVIQRNNQAEGV